MTAKICITIDGKTWRIIGLLLVNYIARYNLIGQEFPFFGEV